MKFLRGLVGFYFWLKERDRLRQEKQREIDALLKDLRAEVAKKGCRIKEF